MERKKVNPKQTCPVDTAIPAASGHFHHQKSRLAENSLTKSFEGTGFYAAHNL